MKLENIMTKKKRFDVNLIPARRMLSIIQYEFTKNAPDMPKQKEFIKTLFAGLDKAQKDNKNQGFLKLTHLSSPDLIERKRDLTLKEATTICKVKKEDYVCEFYTQNDFVYEDYNGWYTLTRFLNKNKWVNYMFVVHTRKHNICFYPNGDNLDGDAYFNAMENSQFKSKEESIELLQELIRL